MLIPRFHSDFRETLLPYLQGIDYIATLLSVAFILFAVRQNLTMAIGILTFTMHVAVISIIPVPEFVA